MYKRTIRKICKVCGKIFYTIPPRKDFAMYCSRKCHYINGPSKKARENMSIARKKLIGEKNPKWKGGDPSHWATIARAIYGEFVINPICDKCGTTAKICIHHKDRNIKNNNINNLQALCRRCHASLHRKTTKRDAKGKFLSNSLGR